MAVCDGRVCRESPVREQGVPGGESGKAVLQGAADLSQLPGPDRNAGAGRGADADT